MKKDKIKVYIYTRVSTTIQVNGYSLDAQKARMKAFAEYNDYKIVGEYEDMPIRLSARAFSRTPLTS